MPHCAKPQKGRVKTDRLPKSLGFGLFSVLAVASAASRCVVAKAESFTLILDSQNTICRKACTSKPCRG